MQLTRLIAALVLVGAASSARAEDRVDSTFTWFQERRGGGDSLTVLHPQADATIGLGSKVSLSAGYEADIVSGATPSVYAAPLVPGQSVDAVSAASQFSDTRHSGRGGISIVGNRASLSAGYTYGTERDYKSHAISSAATVDLPGKNTTFGLGYTHNIDKVCDYDNQMAQPLERRALSGENPCFGGGATAMTVSHDVSIDTFQGSVTQNLTPTLVAQVGVFGQVIRGFQSNPYRRVRVAGFDAQEAVPDIRARSAAFARANLAFPELHAAAGLSLRGYADTWGVQSGALEATYNQYLGDSILFRFRARVHQQTGAKFFRDAIDYQTQGAPGAYFTGDRELMPMRDWLVGARLSWIATATDGKQVWGLFDEADLHLKAEGIWATPLTETAPGGDPTGPMPDAIIGQLAFALIF